MRLAWVYRNRHVADRDFMDVAIEEMLSEANSKRLAGLISESKAMADPDGLPPLPKSDTVYLCVVDRNGNTVSYIQSLFASFGSGRMVPGTGIMLNDRLTGFFGHSY